MAEINMLKVPYFLRASTYDVLVESLKPGKYLYENLDRIAYVFVSSEKRLYHVAMDKTITLIGGEGGGGDLDDLIRTVNEHTHQIAELQTEVDNIDTEIDNKISDAIGNIGTASTVAEFVAESREDAIETANAYTDEQIALNII